MGNDSLNHDDENQQAWLDALDAEFIDQLGPDTADAAVNIEPEPLVERANALNISNASCYTELTHDETVLAGAAEYLNARTLQQLSEFRKVAKALAQDKPVPCCAGCLHMAPYVLIALSDLHPYLNDVLGELAWKCWPDKDDPAQVLSVVSEVLNRKQEETS
jgi:hypothetical protein